MIGHDVHSIFLEMELTGSERRKRILQIAARIFATKGYRGTSIRDIGVEAGVLGGSLYHHIKSKDELFVELHNAAMDMAQRRIEATLANHRDPWERMEAACITLAQIHLHPNSLTLPLMNDIREVPQSVRMQLVTRRDAFEKLFRDLIDTLPLPLEIDRSIYRNALLSQLNSLSDWYRAGGLTPAEIGRQVARIYRH